MSLLHMYKSSLSPLLQIRFKMTDFANKRIEKTSKSVDNREINSKEWTFSSNILPGTYSNLQKCFYLEKLKTRQNRSMDFFVAIKNQ